MSGNNERTTKQQRKSGWSTERRAKQAAAIQKWRPWEKGGVKTSAGKEISKMNAYKHGARSAIAKRLSRLLSQI